jgi:hypothetical protein
MMMAEYDQADANPRTGQTYAAKLRPPNYPTSNRAESLAVKDMPLTAELKDRMGNALEIANRVHSTLFQLRERLVGSPAEVAGTSLDRPEPYCFADAMRSMNSDLQMRLRFIEDLVEELATRL